MCVDLANCGGSCPECQPYRKRLDWCRVRAGWYRARTVDGGLWLHVIERAPRDWSLIPTADEHSAAHPTRYGGYSTKNEAQAVALSIYGSASSSDAGAKP